MWVDEILNNVLAPSAAAGSGILTAVAPTFVNAENPFTVVVPPVAAIVVAEYTFF